MSFLAPIAGAVVGGLMSDGGDGGQQTATKDPWGPAVKPLTNTLNTGQDLERYYQQNPFNPLQQTGYQNLFGDIDAFRTQMAPGLMGFANKLMGTNYSRNQQPQMGLLQAPMQQSQSGLLSSNMAGPFMVPQGQSYGQLDFVQLNPFTATNGIPKPPVEEKPAEKTPEELAREEWERLVRTGEAYRGAGA